MPDWSYRTVLRPLMLSYGCERSRRLAIGTLRTLARMPGGLSLIEILGHMHPDEQLRTRAAGVEMVSPIALDALIDPSGDALPAFSRFGVGFVEVGPVVEQANDAVPHWKVDVRTGEITSPTRVTAGVDAVASNLEQHSARSAPVFVHIGEQTADAVQR